MINPLHLHRRLRELRQRADFLRSLRPGNQSYKLWLGDLVELVTVVWGVASPQMEQIRAELRRAPSSGSEAGFYVQRLERLDLVIEGYMRDMP